MKNSSSLLPRTGEGIVIDIGTGDGRFVSAAASANPGKFYMGIDPNVKPLAKPSIRATRKPTKGGLRNLLFVQAAIEDLPGELDGIADEIHIHFPWGSLLRAVAVGDESALASLERISAPGCFLEIIVGVDPDRDRTEIERLGIPQLTADFLDSILIPKYQAAGFSPLEKRVLTYAEWSTLNTSWSKRLWDYEGRIVTCLIFRARDETRETHETPETV